MGFMGVVLVLDPTSANFTPALLMPVAGGALYAMSAITAQRWCKEEPTLAVLAGFFVVVGLMGVAGCWCLAGQTWGVSSPPDGQASAGRFSAG